jgi:hypothetical protein
VRSSNLRAPTLNAPAPLAASLSPVQFEENTLFNPRAGLAASRLASPEKNF